MSITPNSLVQTDILFTKHFESLSHPLSMTVRQLLGISDYACRQILHLKELLAEEDCQGRLAKEDYQQLIASMRIDNPVQMFAQSLRQFRHRHLLRLLLRELAHLADTQETIAAWSDCADVIILHTLAYCKAQLSKRYGVPRSTSGQVCQLYVIAMGKLGGRELNYSSDVDLIFAFSEAGFTDGEESISNQEYYSKVIQQFIQLLQTVTIDGFVFRIDLRLRPNGDSGPLISNLAAMETYYQEQGRDWERYAMVKARLISVSADVQKDWFERLIIPFVYRRYVDFSVIESLRSMKAMIEREIQLDPMLDDIKRGRGGIREIEFVIQCFQLIRGGRLPQLRQQNAIRALNALKQEDLLSHTAALQQAYLFLRKLENMLQAHNDRQTHALPTDERIRGQIALAMNFNHWDELVERLEQYRRIISHAFHAVLGKADIYEDEKKLLANQFASIWQGHVETTMAVNLLASLGFQEADRCYQMLHAFRHAPRCRRLSQAARLRLDRFMILLLHKLRQVNNTDAVLLQVLHLLEKIVGRSAYLALLTENPTVLEELLHWFAYSPFITSLLVNQPFLLEVLVDQNQAWRPLARYQLDQLLQAHLSHGCDEELQDDLLRQFKLTCWLLAARAELYGQCDALRIGRFLADVAEVIITNVVILACQRLNGRYPEIMTIKSRFAIIAYGKLGAREMNYDSDVDLVFLHKAQSIEEGLVTRLTQKILHMLTMRSQLGVLYSVDTRLRPSGSAGLLVSHVDAFVEYQRVHAWTWEHQALLRARTIFASKSIKATFNHLKANVLSLPRNKASLAKEVKNMREKMNKYTEKDAIKYVPGGLIDLEFLVQFLVLANPAKNRVRRTNTLAQLHDLFHQNVLTQFQFQQLRQAYRRYHEAMHQYLLQSKTATIGEQQANVLAISKEIYASLSSEF
ncbi:bifunctional [glutamate--ammonia ligase]-adenylyl-L-tyrosine phosphorylase/[glutamate--ammonia-ligase] adenylyltransferase [Legionella nagasakiensis]|uniref:bifunctional [glutamate--ammonia ligase]-adenylyl-L-tyrosine phosphorylase/[glutamate--ammonia-ligase] adenylyltransferase n=1 Tax=Legionella nagasakiensis TaxID=535290 RepID=UPI0010548967|nr:bifunctional [glutamate--ammonia ligase]-adenylyl-L-tyrosine phosphorylase/[glutamate--ammonia-ligase] adenylyltransferase [Legionella nagasakiensis]